MNQARIALCFGLVASVVACFSSSSGGGGGEAPDAASAGEDSGLPDTSIAPVEAGFGHDATSAADTGAAADSALDAGVDGAGPGLCGDGAVCPINELTLTPLYPGLKLTWQEGQPCDTVVGEKEYGLVSYPSQQEPPGQPLFTVPGTTLEYSDPTATEVSNQIVYHTRCVVDGVTSVWSNELANFGNTADAGDAGGD